MSAEYTPTGHAHQAASVILHGRRLLLARAGLAVVAVLVVGLFIRAMLLLGMSKSALAADVVAPNVVFATVYWAVAAVLVWRKSDERMALFSALTLNASQEIMQHL